MYVCRNIYNFAEAVTVLRIEFVLTTHVQFKAAKHSLANRVSSVTKTTKSTA